MNYLVGMIDQSLLEVEHIRDKMSEMEREAVDLKDRVETLE